MNSLRRRLAPVFIILVIPLALVLSKEIGSSGSAPRKTGLPTAPKIFVSFASTEAQATALQESTYCWIISDFLTRGFVLSREPREHAVYVDATERGGLVAISFFFGEVIPDSIVQLCRNSEVFYVGLPEKKRKELPADGKWVRDMVSEEYVRQFIYPQSSRVLLVEKIELQKGIEEVVGEYCRVHCGLVGE
jgi:hypothetical protein